MSHWFVRLDSMNSLISDGIIWNVESTLFIVKDANKEVGSDVEVHVRSLLPISSPRLDCSGHPPESLVIEDVRLAITLLFHFAYPPGQ